MTADRVRPFLTYLALSLVIADPAVAKPPSAASGRTLFQANCSACHLVTGAGGKHFGGVVSADLRSPGLEGIYNNSDALLLRAILHG